MLAQYINVKVKFHLVSKQRNLVRTSVMELVELIRAKKQWAPANFSTAIYVGTSLP